MTGANGFLASWIMASLVKAGFTVTAVDLQPNTSRLDQLLGGDNHAKINWVSLDVSNTNAVCDVVVESAPEAIIHLAALQIPNCRENPVLCANVNVVGQVNIFEAARKASVGKIVYTSSAAAKPRGKADAPANLYGVFKKTDEEIARIYYQEHGVVSLGLRPYLVYGIGRDQGDTSAITKAIRAAALGGEYTIPFRTRGCMEYAGEVAEVFLKTIAASWDGAKLSDLTTEMNSIEDLLVEIHAIVPGAQVNAASTVREAPETGFDNSVLKEIIGEWRRVDLKEGVRKTIEHFRSLESIGNGPFSS